MSELRASTIDLDDQVVVPLRGQANLPAPLIDADVDLRNFPTMPLDVARLAQSWIAYGASGDGFRCAVLLWGKAWHQVPAGSLPNDDLLLSQYAGYGRAVDEWRKFRSEALHGFIECSDGRLYHPVVVEMARRAWAKKVGYSERGKAGAEAKKKKGLDETETAAPKIPPEPLSFSLASAQLQPSPSLASTQLQPSPSKEREGKRKGKETLPLGFSDEKPSCECDAREAAPGGITTHTQVFSIPQEWIEEVRRTREDAGLPQSNLVFQAQRFVNHHRALGTRCADWHAKWLSWEQTIDPSKEAAALAATVRTPAEPGEKPPPQPDFAHRLGEGGDRLAERLGFTAFRQWFGAAQLAIDADGSMIFAVKSRFARDWITTHYAAEIDAAFGRRWRVEILAQDGLAPLAGSEPRVAIAETDRQTWPPDCAAGRGERP
jgi:hypothetical protein